MKLLSCRSKKALGLAFCIMFTLLYGQQKTESKMEFNQYNKDLPNSLSHSLNGIFSVARWPLSFAESHPLPPESVDQFWRLYSGHCHGLGLGG